MSPPFDNAPPLLVFAKVLLENCGHTEMCLLMTAPSLFFTEGEEKGGGVIKRICGAINKMKVPFTTTPPPAFFARLGKKLSYILWELDVIKWKLNGGL